MTRKKDQSFKRGTTVRDFLIGQKNRIEGQELHMNSILDHKIISFGYKINQVEKHFTIFCRTSYSYRSYIGSGFFLSFEFEFRTRNRTQKHAKLGLKTRTRKLFFFKFRKYFIGF